MKKTILLASLILFGAASAQSFSTAGVSNNLFDRSEAEVTVTHLNLVGPLRDANGNVTGWYRAYDNGLTATVAGQKYLGAVNGTTTLYGTLRAGGYVYGLSDNSLAVNPFVEGELLAKGTAFSVFGSVRHTRFSNDWAAYSNSFRIGVRAGGLIR